MTVYYSGFAERYDSECTKLMRQLSAKLIPMMDSGKILSYDPYTPLCFSTDNYKQCLNIAENVISKIAHASAGKFNAFKRIDAKVSQGPLTVTTHIANFVASIVWSSCELYISCIILFKRDSDYYTLVFEPIFENVYRNTIRV